MSYVVKVQTRGSLIHYHFTMSFFKSIDHEHKDTEVDITEEPLGNQNQDEEANIESTPLQTVAKDLTVDDENDDNESNTQSDEPHEEPTTESIPLQAIAKRQKI